MARNTRRVVLAACAVGVALAIAVVIGSTVLSPRHGDGRAGGSPKRIAVDSSAALRGTVFFQPVSGDPVVWYAITSNGETELFAGPGRHPVSNEWLKPVTPIVVQLLERRLKSIEQARSDDEARRVATARADAEIARSRTRGRADTPQLPQDPRRPDQPRERPAIIATAPADDPPSTTPQRDPTRPPPAVGTGYGESRRLPSANGGRRESATGADDDDPDRTLRYNALVNAARASIDAGRFDDARTHAQRAIHLDPRRMSARTLWAEAQTRLDARELPALRYERRFRD